MRWTTYISPTDGHEHPGLLHNGAIHGVRQPTRVIDLLGDDGARLIAAGEAALANPFEVVPEPEARLRPPIPVPPSIRDFMAFEHHVATILQASGPNPRHEHEWQVWEQVELPDDKALIAGVIDVKTNHVEHPLLVAQRIERFARILGKERVIAGTDCGFETFVGMNSCHPRVAWLKLDALAQGAKIASKTLW